VKIKWLGHSCFVLTSDAGLKIITDPYTREGGLNYGEIKESADIVLVSHEHHDHNNSAAVKGKPAVLKGPGTKEIRGIKFLGIASFHDEASGSKRGANTIFVFEMDGLRICHLGDLGHDLGNKEISDIGKPDILFIPIGGLYTFDAAVADTVVSKISPRVIIPMHFRTGGIDTAKFGVISGPDKFLNGKKDVRQLDVSETELKAGKLPAASQIIVLKPGL
jgi:L-ascorbate metabolism protein UlaG (beta-lactamase superfamily)